MTVQSQIFESLTKSWEEMCAEASEFATQVGRDNLINITVTAVGGQDFLAAGATGIIIVWYWDNQR